MSANLLANGDLLRRALLAKLDALRERHAEDPLTHARAARTLYKQHNITRGLGGGLHVSSVRTPLGIGIYAAIARAMAAAGSFLWIPRLARPDFLPAPAVAALTYAVITLDPAMPAQTAMQIAAGAGLVPDGLASGRRARAALGRIEQRQRAADVLAQAAHASTHRRGRLAT